MTDSKRSPADREAAELPTEQGGLPGEYTPQVGQPIQHGREQSGAENDGELLISGVNTGPDRAERNTLSPTEERARLSIRAEQEEDEPADADAATGLDRGD
ncbi:hypothetical protein [Deinococcus radiophilus]|uniref:Uncharacterized protein n=1 Tax=Deinococcus radiophilus TaxID=32062 RepID=A0A431W4B4_9DEIO|nr:hypothetical protein [Deinococcus radiophilus]RTR30267.1 hypothetical protein EJ104_01800 [Deinococcus radiophilus]UFA49939.1 hypothetical protein LMT64_08600 [Deinococcus radiophilus]